MPDGGGSQQTVTQTDVPAYAEPYVKDMLGMTKSLTQGAQYTPYTGQRVAQFTPLQHQAFIDTANLGPNANVDAAVGKAAMNADSTFSRLQQDSDGNTYANQFEAPDAYRSAVFQNQTVAAPNLNTFQMGPAQQVQDTAFGQGQANAYMSPYMQSVVEAQQRDATRQADIAQQDRNAYFTKAGAFGGARQAIMDAEAEKNLAQQKGDIQAAGLQSAFTNAQQQFNADQARNMQAQQANQGAGLTTAGQNLQAQLGVQQLGAGQNMQAQLANQQQNMAAQQATEQSRQFGYGQGMTAAGLDAQYGQAANQLSEQSQQFNRGLALQAAQAQMAGANTMSGIGNTHFNQNLAAANARNLLGTQQQQNVQKVLDTNYGDFVNQQNYPYQQLGFMSDMLRGLPLSQSSSTMYGAGGNSAAGLVGAGLTAYNLFGGKAKGGAVKAKKTPKRVGGGLASLATAKVRG